MCLFVYISWAGAVNSVYFDKVHGLPYVCPSSTKGISLKYFCRDHCRCNGLGTSKRTQRGLCSRIRSKRYVTLPQLNIHPPPPLASKNMSNVLRRGDGVITITMVLRSRCWTPDATIGWIWQLRVANPERTLHARALHALIKLLSAGLWPWDWSKRVSSCPQRPRREHRGLPIHGHFPRRDGSGTADAGGFRSGVTAALRSVNTSGRNTHKMYIPF